MPGVQPLKKRCGDVHGGAKVTGIGFAGLEDDELVYMLAAAAGHDLDDAAVGLAHALRRETDGNPFFTAEMLRHLGESGGIVQGGDGRWTVTGDLETPGLPSSVPHAVGRPATPLADPPP